MVDTKKYKTRTMFRKRPNGSVKGMWLLAADIGYSSVKIFSQNSCCVFPSFAEKFTGETVGNLPDWHIIYRDLDTGERWLVGEAAQNDVSQGDATVSEEAVFGRARYDDPMFLVLARTGLGVGMLENEFGAPNDKPLYVQTGLPPRYMKSDTPRLLNALAGEHRFSLKIGDAPEKEFNITLKRDRIGVMEQPKGTLMSVAIGNDHRYVPGARDYLNKNILIFDAGFGTLDIYPIMNNHVGEKQTFPEFSMKQVLKDTCEVIYERYSEEVSMIGMQKCLGDGYIRCHDKFTSRKQEFGDILEETSKKICDTALEKLGQIYPLYEYDYLVITGGTGAAWNEQIREKLAGLDSLEVLDGNQNDTSLPFLFANVRGYFMYLYEKMRRKA